MFVLITKFIISLLGGLMYFPIFKNLKYLHIHVTNIFFWNLLFRWGLLIIWFFFIGGNASGDVMGYELHVKWVSEGLVPNKDFESPYGFYFYYFLLYPYNFFPHPISIIFILQLSEFMGILLFYFGIKKLFSLQKCKLFLLIYFLNPLVLNWFAFDGQDESLLILGFGGLFFTSVYSSILLKALFSGFSLFFAKITGLAAVLPIFLKTNTKEKFILISISLLFLIMPILLESQIFGFQFEREDSFDNLKMTIYPGNAWFIINQFFSKDLNYAIPNEILVLLSRCLFVLLSLLSLILLFRYKKNLTETRFLAIGTILFTLSFQLSSYYTSPGFIAATVPYLIFVFILQNKFENLKIVLFILYFLILPLDIHFYHRNLEEFSNMEGIYFLLFNIFQVCIIFANLFIYLIVIKFLITKTLDHS